MAATRLHLMVALVLSTFLSQTECQTSCEQLEFDTLENTDTTLTVTKNSRVTLTFYINTDKCINSPTDYTIQLLKVKLSTNKSESLVVCDIHLQQQSCTVRNGTSSCRCRSHRKGIVQFSQRVNESHDSEHVWTWMKTGFQGRPQNRSVRFHVVAGEVSGVSFLMLAVGVAATFVAGIVLTSGVAACVVKYRKGHQRYEQLKDDQIQYPGYDAIVCHGEVGAGVEYNEYEEVEYSETPFLMIGTKNICDGRKPYLPCR